MKPSFDQLPDLVAQLHEKLDRIQLFIDAIPASQKDEHDHYLSIKQAAEFINLSVSTVYGLVHNKGIPVCKRGKRLYFSKTELLTWIKTSRKKTREEIHQLAQAHLSNL